MEIKLSQYFYDTTLQGILEENDISSAEELVRQTVENIRQKGGRNAHIMEKKTRVPSEQTLVNFQTEVYERNENIAGFVKVKMDEADASYLRQEFRYGDRNAQITYLVENFIKQRYFDPSNLFSPKEYREYKQEQQDIQKKSLVQPQVVARVNRDLELLLLTIQEYGLSGREIKTVLLGEGIQVTFPYEASPFKDAIQKIRSESGIGELKLLSENEIAQCICLTPQQFEQNLVKIMEARRQREIDALEEEKAQITLRMTKVHEKYDEFNAQVKYQKNLFKLVIKNPDQRAVEILATILHDVNYSRSHDNVMARPAKQAQLEQEVKALLKTPLSSEMNKKDIDERFKITKCKTTIGALLKIKAPDYLSPEQYIEAANILKKMYFYIVDGRPRDVAANAVALFENIPTNDNFPKTLRKFSDVSQAIAAACLAQPTNSKENIAIDVISKQIRSKLNEGNA